MRIFFILITILLSLFADIKADKKSVIEKVIKNEAIIKSIDAPIGSSGVVVHYFDKKHATIVARAELVEKNKIEFRVFDALKQSNLPTPKILPRKNDKVILNFLYDRGLIIAPNLKTYKSIKDRFSEIEWLHPDLFAIELSKSKNPAPTKEDFKKFCNRYSVGILYFALKNQGYFVDCYSFKKIKSENLKVEEDTEIKLPFYTRLKEIESSWFSFYGSSEIKNYFNYYKNLLE